MGQRCNGIEAEYFYCNVQPEIAQVNQVDRFEPESNLVDRFKSSRLVDSISKHLTKLVAKCSRIIAIYPFKLL